MNPKWWPLIVGTPLLALFLCVVILRMGGGPVDHELAVQRACRANLQWIAHELNQIYSSGSLSFEGGVRSFIKRKSSSDALVCPGARDAGSESYEYRSIHGIDELMREVSKGEVLLISDKNGNHSGGKNVLLAKLVDGKLHFVSEWRSSTTSRKEPAAKGRSN